MRIVLIDDDHDDCELFSETVKALNADAHCSTFQNSPEAIDLLLSGTISPDIIFLDVNMPRMNGRECLHSIKADSQLKVIPVVMYSTSNDPKEIKYFMSLGASYVSKPNTIEELARLLEPFLSKQTVL